MSKKKDIKLLFSLFLTFFKIGAFTFGGGYAMIPIIQHEIVKRQKWLSDEDILEIIAVSESTPGPIAINSATFVGYKIAGVLGAFFSTLAVILPSFVLISIISYLLHEFQSIEIIRFAFFGIRAAVLALLIRAVFIMYEKCPKSIFSCSIIAVSFILSAFFDFSLIFIIIFCALSGIIFSLAKVREVKN